MSRFDAAADDRRRLNLEENATESERIRLIAEQDPNVILVRMAFSSSSDGDGPRDLLVRADGAGGRDGDEPRRPWSQSGRDGTRDSGADQAPD